MASANVSTHSLSNSNQKQLDLNNKNDINILMNLETNEELEDVIVHSMIEQFMNLSEEDNRIFNYIKQEFKDMKILTYGSLLFIQTDQNIENFPHISELLQIYEEVFGNKDCKSCFVLRGEKHYILYNDGFITIADNGIKDKIFVYKIKTLVIILNVNDSKISGEYNQRILKLLKVIKYI